MQFNTIDLHEDLVNVEGVTVTQVESKVEPDSVTDDVGWESVAFVSIHQPILAISGSLFGNTLGSNAAARLRENFQTSAEMRARNWRALCSPAAPQHLPPSAVHYPIASGRSRGAVPPELPCKRSPLFSSGELTYG